MTGRTRAYALDISEHLFLLTTEGIRLRSNETRRYQTLAKLVTDRLQVEPRLGVEDLVSLREHLEATPTKGGIRIHLNISRTSANSLIDVKKRLAQELGGDLTVGDALSILLFDYIAERATDLAVRRSSHAASEPRGVEDDCPP
ncbi:hypothetical protein PX554_20290 [Sphingomonas sp. H39-1-10]|uniref:hypothetical protein n=1 Tax=Sphingomonas pollutisoli TaxID=3030829 RepID=UPI0023B9999D|nr:hypothetical protein [Sphingomonas pollutisoli]MDF0490474.1 hypothetical protein [Sphingomonas pollutisoli]